MREGMGDTYHGNWSTLGARSLHTFPDFPAHLVGRSLADRDTCLFAPTEARPSISPCASARPPARESDVLIPRPHHGPNLKFWHGFHRQSLSTWELETHSIRIKHTGRSLFQVSYHATVDPRTTQVWTVWSIYTRTFFNKYTVPINKQEFLFHIIFSFLMSSISSIYNIYIVLYHIRQ